MIPWTTPNLRFRIRADVDLSLADSLYVSIEQPTAQILLTGDDVEADGNRVSCWLTQEQSGGLKVGTAKVQINWTMTDDVSGKTRRGSTKTKSIKIDEQLLERAI